MQTKTNTFKVGDTIFVATHGKVNKRIISMIWSDEKG